MPAEIVAVPAATLLLLRDGPTGLEVLMTTRNRGAAFAGGALVFPGGKVDPGDAPLARAGDPVALAEVAAVRETFEETGILLAHGARAAEIAAREAMARQRADGRPFGPMLAEFDLVPALGGLAYFAHWITPRSRAKRFDTHFFLAEAPSDQDALADGTEAVDALWITPQAAIDAAADKKVKLVFATYINLKKIAAYPDAASCIAAARTSKVVTCQPEEVEIDGMTMIQIPEEAGYGLSRIRIDAFEAAIGRAQ